jgi:mRNA interferase MazF
LAEGVNRGDYITAVRPGDYGKPRPALVVQADEYALLPSVIVCPVTTHLQPDPIIRIQVEPTVDNGLDHTSQLMVDKLSVIPVTRIGRRIGAANDEVMLRVGAAITRILGLA